MDNFILRDRSLLVTVSHSEVPGVEHSNPIRHAVYVPGTLCSDWQNHPYTVLNIDHAYVIWDNKKWLMLGKKCLIKYSANALTYHWQRVMDNRHPYVGLGLSINFGDKLPAEYRKVVPLMAMICQVEEHSFLLGCLTQLANGRALSAKKNEVVRHILQERGADHVPVEEAFSAKGLKEHRKVILARRNFAFRLARLETFDLRPEHRTKVESLQEDIHRYWKGLTPDQQNLVMKLERTYVDQMAAKTEALLSKLVANYDLKGA